VFGSAVLIVPFPAAAAALDALLPDAVGVLFGFWGLEVVEQTGDLFQRVAGRGDVLAADGVGDAASRN
jgi:hypothetical protein